MNKKYRNAHAHPSFSIANRLARVLWGAVYWTFFRFSPAPLHAWRAFLLRRFGAVIGRSTHIYPGVRIWAPWNIEIGDESGVASGVILYSQDKIRIGYRAVISQGAHLCTGTHDYTRPGFPLITKPIVIGAEAWLAAECFVMPGIMVGEGAVVGARSIVTKNIPTWTVCVGHPCVAIQPRTIINE